jgi:hypothetical protein
MPFFSLDFSGNFLSALVLLGMANVTIKAMRFARCQLSRLTNYMRSFRNSNKYLESVNKSTQLTYSAVIYGASTKVGKAFAHYLGKQGFNLILIERDLNQLNHLEVNLNTDLLQPPKITKVVIDRFDQDSLWKAVGGNYQVREH